MITATGLEIDSQTALSEKYVRAYDVAWALHNTNMFHGHSPVPWDLLSHAGLVYRLYAQDVKGQVDVKTSLVLLLSRAPEIYDTYPDFLWDILSRFGVYAKDVLARENYLSAIGRYENAATAFEYSILFPQASNPPKSDFVVGLPTILVKAKVSDYIELLKQLAITNSVTDIGALFHCSEFLQTYIDLEYAPKDANTKFETAQTTGDVEGLRL
jgi:hypothetical protein